MATKDDTDLSHIGLKELKGTLYFWNKFSYKIGSCIDSLVSVRHVIFYKYFCHVAWHMPQFQFTCSKANHHNHYLSGCALYKKGFWKIKSTLYTLKKQ